MKTNIRQDFIECQNLLKELGFESSGPDIGFRWYFDKLEILISPKDYHIYDNISRTNVIRPHILISYRYDGGEVFDVLVSQNYDQIRSTIISNSLFDLRIKELNRNFKLYTLLNPDFELTETKPGSISCMALKLNPKLWNVFQYEKI